MSRNEPRGLAQLPSSAPSGHLLPQGGEGTRWFTVAALLALGLPALPADKGGLNRLIVREGWRGSHLAREGKEGWEYNLALLPAEAQAALLARESPLPEGAENAPPERFHFAPSSPTRGEVKSDAAWAAFERLADKAQDEARRRLGIVDQVAALKAGGTKAGEAVALVSRRAGIASSTLWGWLGLCDGVRRADWLPALAPRRKGRTATVACDPRAWDFFVADYLRPERPGLSACYRRLEETAAARGWSPVPSLKTLQRRLERTIPAAARTLARDGRDAAARLYPHQRRDRTGFAALAAVNADGHKFDVFVRFEDGHIGRPLAAVVQDLGTGMILGHRLAESENWTSVRLAFADMVERYGIPEACWLDNGRAFASKWLTGGMKTRYRFKVKDDEPAGILTQLGIKVHWTTPYHGQSKPIERAFRDLCEEISRHPVCAGAYTGNTIDAKPENYGSRAMPIAQFRALVASEIARHNARKGRRGAGLNGESFADAFARSLAAPGTIVTRATATQRRLLLMAAEGVTCRKPTGEIELGGNRYWAEELVKLIGRQVTIRFDPDDLHLPIAVYDRDGRLICEAPAIETSGFADADAAQNHNRKRRQWIKGQRELLALEKRLGIAAVAEMLPPLPPPPAPTAVPVVRLVQQPAAASSSQASFSRAVRARAQLENDDLIPFPSAGTS